MSHVRAVVGDRECSSVHEGFCLQVGYGDVSPKNNLERCMAMLIMIVGVVPFVLTSLVSQWQMTL